MPGAPICHIVIPARDLSQMKSFYEGIFGWTVQENVPGPRYWFFNTEGAGGAFDPDLQPGSGVVLILQVDDMEATLRSIEAQGGTITRGRSKIGDADPGWDAYFTDPSGNPMGVYSAS